jgi:hypothetical protein
MTARIGQALDHYPTRVPGSTQPGLVERIEPTVWGHHASAGMFGAQELGRHERDGFVTVPGLLSPAEIAGFQAELDRLATDPVVRADERTIIEKSSDEVRSIFEVHRISVAIGALAADERVAGRARQVLGSEVYVHQALHRRGVLLALGLRDVARRGRHARDARGERVHLADREPPIQRLLDDHAGLPPNVRALRRGDARRALSLLAA